MTTATEATVFDEATEELAQSLVSVARRLFTERGYRQTGFADLAAAVGLSEGEAARLYPDKAAVFAALVERTVLVSGLLAGDLARGVDEELPIRLARTYLSLWEPQDGEESPLVELYRVALSDPEASRVLKDTVTDRLNGQVDTEVPGPDPRFRTAAFGAHLGGLAFVRHLLGVEPLASKSLDEVLELVGPGLRHVLLGGEEG
ncbi:TetR family transcriptional regulator [Streptomyces sp. NPDC089919]|uniref:TetR/AcrR family transcriptional regulator n=1 Tax=Streptomyces sp. NPDC089919 TaxID=3155188 RepID=UPI00341C16DD